MPPKGKVSKAGKGVFPDGIEKDNIDGDVAKLMPFYKLATVYQPEKVRKSDIRSDPAGLPVFDARAFETVFNRSGVAFNSLPKQRRTGQYVGLTNVGNTCYVNSLLQYLFVNSAFRRRILAQEDTKDKILRSLQTLFGLMQNTSDAVCDPGDFVDSTGITRGLQEDVTEFWNMLIEHLRRETQGSIRDLVAFKQATVVQCSSCKRTSARDETLFEMHVKPPADMDQAKTMIDLTGAWTMSVQDDVCEPDGLVRPRVTLFHYEWVHMPGASHFTGVALIYSDASGSYDERHEITNGRLIDNRVSWQVGRGKTECAAEVSSCGSSLINGISGPAKSPFSGKKKKAALPSVFLEEALGSSFIEETLSGENSYRCETCGGLRDATRSNSVQSLPPFLHIIFDRFSWDAKVEQRKRICCEIVFPEALSLENFTTSRGERPNTAEMLGVDGSFELIGVLNHHSNTAESGHYTATLRHPADTDAIEEMSGSDPAPAKSSSDHARWVQFNDSQVTAEGQSPGTYVGVAETGGKQWTSKSAYMLIYRRTDHRTAKEYTESGSIPLPSSVADDVGKCIKERDGFVKEFKKNSDLHIRMLQSRGHHAEMIQASLQMPEGQTVPARDLAVVPTTWLDDWMKGQEADPQKGGLTQISYTSLLLPSVDWTKCLRLDPFAMWTGRAKVLPKSLLETGFLGCYGARGMEKTRMLPSELSNMDDVSFQALSCLRTVTTLQKLMVCTRNLLNHLLKIRDDEPEQNQGGTPFIYTSAITQMLQKYATLGYPKSGPQRGRRSKYIPTSEVIWQQLHCEWRGLESSSFGIERSGKKADVIDLAGPSDKRLLCPHGQRRPRLGAIKASEADLQELLRLEKERVDLWKEFGARGVFVRVRIVIGELPGVDSSECEVCKGEFKNFTAVKRELNQDKQAAKKDFKVLTSGKYPMDRGGMFPQLQVGKYHMVPADWREKWREYLEQQDIFAPPHLDPSVLRCEHGGLQYDPTEYFKHSKDAAHGNIKDRHPDSDAYILVPVKEAEQLYIKYGPAGTPAWCSLQCTKEPVDSFPDRTFTCDPPLCELCTGADASYTLDLKVEADTVTLKYTKDENAAAVLSGDQKVIAKGKDTGLDIKSRIIKELGLSFSVEKQPFHDVDPGQILMSINDKSFGDCDSLLQVLGRQARLRHASLPLTFEVYAMSLTAEPAAKRHCSSLLTSNLVERPRTGDQSIPDINHIVVD